MPKVSAVGLILTPVGTGLTVTLQVAFFPFTVFAVITAVPTAFAVTLPVLLTAATLLLLVYHLQVLFFASFGKTVLLRV